MRYAENFFFSMYMSKASLHIKLELARYTCWWEESGHIFSSFQTRWSYSPNIVKQFRSGFTFRPLGSTEAEVAPGYVASVRACCVKSCGPVRLTRTSQHGVVGRKQEGLFKLPLAFSKNPQHPSYSMLLLPSNQLGLEREEASRMCMYIHGWAGKQIHPAASPSPASARRHVKSHHTPPGPPQHHPKTRHMERMIRIIYCWHICLVGKQHTDSLCCLYRSFSQSSIRKMT